MRVPAAIIGLTFALPAFAEQSFPTLNLHGLIDLRAAYTDDQVSWLDRGQGKTRFGGKRGDGRRITGGLGEASLILQSEFSWAARGHLHVKADTEQKSPVDAVEGYIAYRPVSTSAWQLGGKVGAFFRRCRWRISIWPGRALTRSAGRP